MVERFYKVLSNCWYHERYAIGFPAQSVFTARIFRGFAGTGLEMYNPTQGRKHTFDFFALTVECYIGNV